MTTEEEDAERAFVDYIVGLAPSVEGIAGCVPIEGELGVVLVLDRDVAAAGEAEQVDGTRTHLGKLFHETRTLEQGAIEERCRHYLRGMVAASQELPDWEGAKPRVFTAIRSLGYFHTLGGGAVVARRFLPMLAECVVLDLGEALTYVTTALVERWGVAMDELFAVAHANVEGRLQHDLTPEGDDEPPKIYRLEAGDSYESSRLGSLSWLAKAREALGTDGMVCAIPDRDTLLLAVDASPPTLVRLAELAERTYAESSRGISPALYVFTAENELGALDLVDEHPLRERIRRGHLMLADVEYGSQKIALDAELAGADQQVFIASFFAADRDGMVFSYATWAEGVSALLPHVDLMAFTFIDQRRPLLVPFEVVTQAVGELLAQVDELEPVRYRTDGFPSEELLAAMAEYAVDM